MYGLKHRLIVYQIMYIEQSVSMIQINLSRGRLILICIQFERIKIILKFYDYLWTSLQADSIQILFIKFNMIDLIILVALIYLASRVCLRAFDSIYSLFCRGQSQLPDVALIDDNKNGKDDKLKKDPSPTTSPKTKNIKQESNSALKVKKKNSDSVQRQPIKVKASPKSSLKKPDQKEAFQKNVSSLQNITSEVNSPKTGVFRSDVCETKKEEVQQGSIFTTFNKVESPIKKENKDGRYQMEIQNLRSQIQRSREEKKVYILQIEDIIQQITSQQIYELTEEVQTDDSIQFQAIQKLKLEINNSRKGEKRLLQQLRQSFELQKDNLRKDYELRIQGLLSGQETKPVHQQGGNQLIVLPLRPLTSMQNLQRKESSQIIRLEEENYRYRQQIQHKTQELSVTNKQLQQTIQMCQGYQSQISELKQKLVHEQNNHIELTFKFNSQIESLQLQKDRLENELSAMHESQFKGQQQIQASLSKKDMENVVKYQIQIEELTIKLSSEQREKDRLVKKVEEVEEELKFCQTKIELSLATQTKLREEVNALRLAQITPKLSLFQVQNHPEYQKLQLQLQSYQKQLKSRPQKQQLYKIETYPTSMSSSAVQRKINYARPTKERDPSPLVASSTKNQLVTPPDVKTSTKLSPYRSNIINPTDKPTSTLFTEIFQRKQSDRYKTPFEKPSFTSSIREGSNVGETYFGQTNILTEDKRNFVIAEINRLKKIGAKKTKLMYRSLAKNTKPISEFISNVPNLFVVVQLANKKILGAFTQTAFATKENNSGLEKSKYISQNKSMIIDITEEKVFVNANGSTQDTIKYDQNALVWGRYEFVVSFVEPLLFSCDLNCENAIYPCVYSNPELLGGNEANIPISQFEVYRIFLG